MQKYTYHPVKEYTDLDGEVTIKKVAPEDLVDEDLEEEDMEFCGKVRAFWSVYEVKEHGEEYAIADCPDESSAKMISEALNSQPDTKELNAQIDKVGNLADNLLSKMEQLVLALPKKDKKHYAAQLNDPGKLLCHPDDKKKSK